MRCSNKKFRKNRGFLKDSIRKKINFSCTGQQLNLPAPPLQKPYPPESSLIELPSGPESLALMGRMPFCDSVFRRESVRRFSPQPLSLKQISALLWACQGIRRILSPDCALRVVPSAGARHSFETYLAVSRVVGLVPGLYRYLPFDGGLILLKSDEQMGYLAAAACFQQGFVAAAAAIFFWTVIPARMEWRYDLAAHKVLALDAGHVCQNLYLAATSLGLGACAIAAYDQEACDRLLGIDGEEEFTIYIAALGQPG